MKNATLLGSSLLGTWTAQTELSTKKDSLSAYLVAHFMADPRKGFGCSLPDCKEFQNHACMISQDKDGHAQRSCRDIGQEEDMAWSDGEFLLVHYFSNIVFTSFESHRCLPSFYFPFRLKKSLHFFILGSKLILNLGLRHILD